MYTIAILYICEEKKIIDPKSIVCFNFMLSRIPGYLLYYFTRSRRVNAIYYFRYAAEGFVVVVVVVVYPGVYTRAKQTSTNKIYTIVARWTV